MQMPGGDAPWRRTDSRNEEYRQGLTRGVLLGGAGTILALGGVLASVVAFAAGPEHQPTAGAAQAAAAVPAAVAAAAPAAATAVVPVAVAPAVAPAVVPAVVPAPAAVPLSTYAVVPAAAPTIANSAAAVASAAAALPAVASSDCTNSVLSAALAAFFQHLQVAHLQESPFQQLSDILNTDQYVKTHTVLLENMLQPLLTQLPAILDGLTTAFVQHLDAAHLQESPFQQLSDILNTNQYVKTHTVLVENMLSNLFTALTSSCGTTPPPTAMPMPMPMTPPPAATPVTVKIAGYAFAPPTLSVPVGTTVTWANMDQVPHTVDSSTSAFSSGLMNTGATYSHTFSTAGTFKYYCAVHPDMIGTISVG